MAQVEIKKLDSQQRGIGYIHDKIIFVPKTIPGEVCEVEIVKEKRNFQEGKLQKVLKASEKRILAKCPYYHQCGGCDLEHISYEESVKWKRKALEELFLRNELWREDISVISTEQPWNYRNKVSLKVKDGKFGYYNIESHTFVAILECQIARKAINDVLKDFASFAFSHGELVIRCNENDEILMDIVTDDKVLIQEDFVDRHKVVGIFVNHQCVYGKPYFFERKNGVLYQVAMNSFFQVNPFMSNVLFQYVGKALKNEKKVLDLYCGVGTLGLQLDKNVKLTGIEIVQSAVLNALTNARLNSFLNTSFHFGKVEQLIDKMKFDFDAVIVDPPRAGLDDVTRKTLLTISPKKILYVSCNPITLVRDLKAFVGDYQILSVQGFDMFPFTKHVECVCVLYRR